LGAILTMKRLVMYYMNKYGVVNKRIINKNCHTHCQYKLFYLKQIKLSLYSKKNLFLEMLYRTFRNMKKVPFKVSLNDLLK
jgi:hypothetical protein